MTKGIRKKDKGIHKNPSANTPKKFDGFIDHRYEEGAGEYPNQAWVMNTKSGHSINIDDSEGLESMTFQHRSGSCIQFQPNGAIAMTAHNSLYNLVFGENRLMITGANDLVVKGDGSLFCYGDFNKTIHGNTNWTTTGDFNLTAENLNRMVRGNIDTEAKNETKKLEGSSALNAQGAVAMASKDSFTVASRKDKLHLGGGAGINAQVHEGNFNASIENSGNFHLEAKNGTLEAKIHDAIKLLSETGALHMIAQEAATMVSKQNDVKIQSENGNAILKADTGDTSVTGQTAHFEGHAATYVASASGNINIKAPSGHVFGDAGQTSNWMSNLAQEFPGIQLPGSENASAGTGKTARPATKTAATPPDNPRQELA